MSSSDETINKKFAMKTAKFDRRLKELFMRVYGDKVRDMTLEELRGALKVTADMCAHSFCTVCKKRKLVYARGLIFSDSLDMSDDSVTYERCGNKRCPESHEWLMSQDNRGYPIDAIEMQVRREEAIRELRGQ